jgi:hypothetical protein
MHPESLDVNYMLARDCSDGSLVRFLLGQPNRDLPRSGRQGEGERSRNLAGAASG